MNVVSSELTISATELKAKLLSVLKRVRERQVTRVIVTHRGVEIAELAPLRLPVPDDWLKRLQDKMAGQIWIDPTLDLTQPIFDGEMNAEKGILYNE